MGRKARSRCAESAFDLEIAEEAAKDKTKAPVTARTVTRKSSGRISNSGTSAGVQIREKRSTARPTNAR